MCHEEKEKGGLEHVVVAEIVVVAGRERSNYAGAWDLYVGSPAKRTTLPPTTS